MPNQRWSAMGECQKHKWLLTCNRRDHKKEGSRLQLDVTGTDLQTAGPANLVAATASGAA
jgi:hypothetical protein